METNELMINDFVYRKQHEEFHKKVPQSVVKIDGIETEMVTIAPRSEYLDADEIEPIPLTVEILEKNFEIAFEKAFGIAFDTFKIKGYLIQNEGGVWWFGYINRIFCKICPVNYVHELQHALRLGGLTEVADNLKIYQL